MSESLSSLLLSAAEKSQRSGRHRFLETNSSAQSSNITVAGRALTNFCSNDYLGLANHPLVKSAAVEAISHYGLGSGAAQLLSGRHACHDSLETHLAAFMGFEAALIYSSGYLANLGLISALVSRHDVVHQDKLNHASLIDAVKLSGAGTHRYPHQDIQTLEANLHRNREKRQWIVTDAVFSMDGDVAPLQEISGLASQYNATLIVDDAHGFGVLGNGHGTGAELGLSTEKIPITMVTFGKALGTQGAAVLGSRALIDFLIQSSRTFIYDTAMPPAIAAATEKALELIENQAELLMQLRKNIALFRQRCSAAGIPLEESNTPIQPLILGEESVALRAAAYLRDEGIYVRAVRPPTVPAGSSRLRICLTSAHTPEQIEKLVTSLQAILRDEK